MVLQPKVNAINARAAIGKHCSRPPLPAHSAHSCHSPPPPSYICHSSSAAPSGGGCEEGTCHVVSAKWIFVGVRPSLFVVANGARGSLQLIEWVQQDARGAKEVCRCDRMRSECELSIFFLISTLKFIQILINSLVFSLCFSFLCSIFLHVFRLFIFFSFSFSFFLLLSLSSKLTLSYIVPFLFVFLIIFSHLFPLSESFTFSPRYYIILYTILYYI